MNIDSAWKNVDMEITKFDAQEPVDDIKDITAVHTAIKQLLTEARLDELDRLHNKVRLEYSNKNLERGVVLLDDIGSRIVELKKEYGIKE